MFLFKNNAEKELGRLVLDLFLFLKEALYKVKGSAQHFSFNIFNISSLRYIIKANLITFQSAQF